MTPLVAKTQVHFAASSELDPRVASGLGITVSSLVLLGWILDVPLLQSILPGQPQMVPLTAVLFILASVSLATLKNKRSVSVLCAFAVIVIAVLIISEYIGRFDLGLDRLLFSRRLEVNDRSF